MVSSRVTRRRRFPSYRKVVRRVDESLEPASSMEIRSRWSPRFIMCGSILDSKFAGNIGGVALAASLINIKNRPLYRTAPRFIQIKNSIWQHSHFCRPLLPLSTGISLPPCSEFVKLIDEPDSHRVTTHSHFIFKYSIHQCTCPQLRSLRFPLAHVMNQLHGLRMATARKRLDGF